MLDRLTALITSYWQFRLVRLGCLAMLLFISTIAGEQSFLCQRWVVNWAQVSRLHGHIDWALDLLTHSVEGAQRSEHLRWQIAQLYKATGDLDAALNVLSDNHSQSQLSLPARSLLVELLVSVGETAKALTYYLNSEEDLRLQSPVAAKLASITLQNNNQHRTQQIDSLLRQALEFEDIYAVKTGTVEFEQLMMALDQPESNPAKIWQRIQRTLAWKQRPISPDKEHNTEDILGSTLLDNIAATLGIEMHAIRLGDNLVVNGGFEKATEDAQTPDGWEYRLSIQGNLYSFNHEGTNRAAFVAGQDTAIRYSGESALRLDGLYVQHDAALDPAVASFQHAPIFISTNTWYTINVYYCTEDIDNGWLQLWLLTDYGFTLPATDRVWNEVTIIAYSGPDGVMIQPTLSSNATGSVWFDNISVRKLSIDSESSPVPITLPTLLLLPHQNSDACES